MVGTNVTMQVRDEAWIKMETEETERDLKEESTGLAADWKERGEQGGDKGDARSQRLMPGENNNASNRSKQSGGDSLVTSET